jgi:hypothetical protein
MENPTKGVVLVEDTVLKGGRERVSQVGKASWWAWGRFYIFFFPVPPSISE